MKKIFYLITIIGLFSIACDPKKTNPEPTGPRLIFKFKFDSTQTRLDNLARPSSIPVGNSAQSPVFHKMSAHYIELATDSFCLLYTSPSPRDRTRSRMPSSA